MGLSGPVHDVVLRFKGSHKESSFEQEFDKQGILFQKMLALLTLRSQESRNSYSKFSKRRSESEACNSTIANVDTGLCNERYSVLYTNPLFSSSLSVLNRISENFSCHSVHWAMFLLFCTLYCKGMWHRCLYFKRRPNELYGNKVCSESDLN